MLDQTPNDGCDCDDANHADSLQSIETAAALAISLVSPIDRQSDISLGFTCGRTVAQDCCSQQAMPFFDNSAMDGFAVRLSDIELTRTLPICGTVAAGEVPAPLPSGQTMRIFTGAPVPIGADAVIKVEDTLERADAVVLNGHAPKLGQNIRGKGSDQAKGTMLVRKGARIAAHHIGLLAAQGFNTVNVVERPRVAVASTGEELHHDAPRGARIFDANRPMLMALAADMGAEVTDLGVIPDDVAQTSAVLKEAGDCCDLILTSGAVSMGGKDHMRAAVQAAGGQVNGWRVAVKPGKPVMFGRVAGAAITGLPGNPFAAFVGFHLFAARQIEHLLGATSVGAHLSTPALAAFDWSRKPGRSEIFPVQLLGHTDDGLPLLKRLGHSVSATLLPLSEADGIARVERTTSHVGPGDRLNWQPFAQMGPHARERFHGL